MSEKTICVFTPTYNRAYCLERLYDSLVAQTCDDFMWLIVDDGSTDDTESLVESLQNRHELEIEYHQQANGGKQRAHNTGVSLCNNELFFCVDSDDVLTPNAIALIKAKWDEVSGEKTVAGIISLCGANENTALGSEMPSGVPLTTRWDLYYKHKFREDTATAYRTDILRQFPFVVADGEKFIAETYVYHQIDQEYVLATLNRVTIVPEYLEDGYTHNVRQVTKDNPIGYMVLKRNFIEYSDTFPLKFYNSVLYLVGCILSKSKHGIVSAPYPWIALLAYLPARLLCLTIYR